MHLIDNVMQENTFLKGVVEQTLDLVHLYESTAEVLVTKTTGITVGTRYGELETVECDDHRILRINIFYKKNQKGSAFSNDFSKKAIINTVDSALNIARYTFPDPCANIADKELLDFNPMNLDLFHPISLDPKLGKKLASLSEKIALEYDKRIVGTEGGKFNGYLTTKVFGNSHGMIQSYSSSQYSLLCSVIAEKDGMMEQNYAYTLSRVFDNLYSSEWVGKECAIRALQHLGAKKIKTTECPVIFVAEVATSLFSHLANAINGTNIYRKSTFLLNYLKKKIFPAWFSIQEYPHIPQGLGSVPFDNEGIKTLDRTIIKDGVLNSWLLNNYSARKIGLKSTGHADGIYNWYISHNNLSFKELVKHMYRGLIVTDIMGQGVNIVTGDYSRGVSGFWVENGNIQYPVNEITISSNLKEMFYGIDAISNDIETRSNIRCGSVLIASMQIAGV